jgi:hypothetical protein
LSVKTADASALFNSTEADLPADAFQPGPIVADVNIALKLKPPQPDAQHYRESLLETISHELNLHLLPWARVMMHKDLTAITQQNMDNYPPAQLERICRVLGYSGDLTTDEGRQRLGVDIRGDAANKSMRNLMVDENTPAHHATRLGNHADVGLWLIHLQNLAKLFDREPATNKGTLVAKAIKKIRDPMLLTGDPATAIVRNPDAATRCVELLHSFVDKYAALVADRQGFEADIVWIAQRILAYETHARGPGGPESQGKPASYLRV